MIADDHQLPLPLASAPQAKRTAALRSFKARHETAEEALAGEAKAQRQEDIILEHMRKDWKPYMRWTPSQLNDQWHLGKYGWPITSIRRALTNLTAKGLLRKHPEDRRLGPRGSKECTWSLA